MTETDELFRAIKKMEGRIDSIDFTLEQVLACLPQEQLKAKIIPALSSLKARRVYLALGSPASQEEIRERLGANGITVSQPSVSRFLSTFIELGLVKIIDVRERENIYARTTLDRLLEISAELEKNDG